MDVTSMFKACAKTVRSRRKALEGMEKKGSRSDVLLAFTAKSINKSADDQRFSVKTKQLVANITQLKEFLMKHKKEYINFRHLTSDYEGMNDAERDSIDCDAEKYMHLCFNILRQLKKEFVPEGKIESRDLKSHQGVVVSLLEDYLKDVCRVYSEQKAIRVKRSVDLQKISRLEPERNITGKTMEVSVEKDEMIENDMKVRNQRNEDKLFSYGQFESEQLSQEEIQMFEEENKDLHGELNSLVDEVRQVEGKVVEIARLQQIFSEKILQQDKEMKIISETAVGTTENVKDANEQIRQAMKRNSGFRIWILFFLLVLSFSLLFLDWYNP